MLMKDLASAAPWGIVIYDVHDAASCYANDACRDLFGGLPREKHGEENKAPSWLDMVALEDRRAVADSLALLEKPGDTSECTFRPAGAASPAGYASPAGSAGHVKRITMKAALVELDGSRYIILYLADATSGRKDESATIACKEAAIDAYRQQLQIIDSVSETDLICKGRCNLTLGKTFYDQSFDHERRFPFGEDYDENLETVAQSAASANEASRILELYSRESLIARFERGLVETSFTYMRKSQTASLLWTEIRCHAFKVPGNREIMCFAYAYDRSVQVLESKVAKRLAETEHDYLAIIDLEDRLIYMYNIGHDVEETNPRKTPQYDDDVAFAVEKVVVPEDRAHALACMSLENIVRHLDEDGTYSFTFGVVDPQGKVMRKALNYCYLDDSKRDVLMSRTDVTALYNAEQEQIRQTNEAMRAAQKASEAKSDFLSNMSHEIRIPMNAIMGLTQLAREELVGNETVASYLESIELSSNYLLDIINDILDMSRIENGKLEMDYTWVPQNVMPTPASA